MDFHHYGLFLFAKKIVLDNQTNQTTKTSVVSRKNFISTENSLDQIQQVFLLFHEIRCIQKVQLFIAIVQ